MNETFIYEMSVIIAIGIGAQWLSWRIRWPSIVLWILAGIVAGPYFGWINPEEALGDVFHPTVELASAIILFEGGLSLRYKEFRQIGGGIRRLVSSGLIMHFSFLSLAGHYIARWTWEFSFLVAAILVVTGPTVITPVIRQIKLKKRSATFLKWEGIINDPIGALLAIVIFRYIQTSEQETWIDVSLGITKAVALALAVSFGLSYVLNLVFKREKAPDFLKVPIVFGLVLVSYTVVGYLQEGAGLLAVTLFGIFVGNKELPVIEEVKKFKESISTFLIAILFVSLASTIEFADLEALNTGEWLFIVSVLLLLRPLAISAATIKSEITWPERIIISWFAPRGIVAASVAGVLSYGLSESGFVEAEKLIPVVFAVIFLTVVIYGFTVRGLAEKLGLTGERCGVILAADKEWAVNLAFALQNADLKVLIVSQDDQILQMAKREGLETVKGEVVDLVATGALDLSDYTQFFATTGNSSYNALACQKMARHLGPDNVFQFPRSKTSSGIGPRFLPAELRGRFANRSYVIDTIDEEFAEGAEFRVCHHKSPKDCGDNQKILFWVDKNRIVANPRKRKVTPSRAIVMVTP